MNMKHIVLWVQHRKQQKYIRPFVGVFVLVRVGELMVWETVQHYNRIVHKSNRNHNRL